MKRGLIDGLMLIFVVILAGCIEENYYTTSPTELVIYYLDNDGDGYGARTAYVGESVPPYYVTNNLDCNDNNPSIHPGAAEIYGNTVGGNTVDEDCDGQLNNGYAIFTFDSIAALSGEYWQWYNGLGYAQQIGLATPTLHSGGDISDFMYGFITLDLSSFTLGWSRVRAVSIKFKAEESGNDWVEIIPWYIDYNLLQECEFWPTYDSDGNYYVRQIPDGCTIPTISFGNNFFEAAYQNDGWLISGDDLHTYFWLHQQEKITFWVFSSEVLSNEATVSIIYKE